MALLVLAELGIYTGLEPGLAIALTVACVVTATLLPVLLGQSGFWTAKEGASLNRSQASAKARASAS